MGSAVRWITSTPPTKCMAPGPLSHQNLSTERPYHVAPDPLLCNLFCRGNLYRSPPFSGIREQKKVTNGNWWKWMRDPRVYAIIIENFAAATQQQQQQQQQPRPRPQPQPQPQRQQHYSMNTFTRPFIELHWFWVVVKMSIEAAEFVYYRRTAVVAIVVEAANRALGAVNSSSSSIVKPNPSGFPGPRHISTTLASCMSSRSCLRPVVTVLWHTTCYS